jgi:hypothetical protein
MNIFGRRRFNNSVFLAAAMYPLRWPPTRFAVAVVDVAQRGRAVYRLPVGCTALRVALLGAVALGKSNAILLHVKDHIVAC